jgi:hypothetical protein
LVDLGTLSWTIVRHSETRDWRWLERAIDAAQKVRAAHDPDDQWPGAHRDRVRRTLKEILVLRGEKSELRLVSRILEIVGTGYVPRDSRRGVRGKRRSLLEVTRFPISVQVVQGPRPDAVKYEVQIGVTKVDR